MCDHPCLYALMLFFHLEDADPPIPPKPPRSSSTEPTQHAPHLTISVPSTCSPVIVSTDSETVATVEAGSHPCRFHVNCCYLLFDSYSFFFSLDAAGITSDLLFSNLNVCVSIPTLQVLGLRVSKLNFASVPGFLRSLGQQSC